MRFGFLMKQFFSQFEENTRIISLRFSDILNDTYFLHDT